MSTSSLKRGFTLIELLTSLSIFAIVVTISLGSILGIFASNRKSRSLRTIMGNINLAMETMSKEMRYGTKYHCGSSGNITSPQDCSSGGTFMSFLSSDGIQITYRVNGTTLERQEGTNGDWLPFLASGISIQSTPFYTTGTAANDGHQPKVIIKLQGIIGVSGADRGQTTFTIQSMVSQRDIDS